MRSETWVSPVLGSPDAWPQSLRSVVGLMLGSRFPMFVAWGPDLGFLYNDAYSEILGAKHPSALGRRFEEVWSEIWPDVAPLVDAAMAGEASFRENMPLRMNRRGFDEDTWFTFSYSPVRDESGLVAGMFCACQETTGQVLAARQSAEEAQRQQRQFEQAPGFICTFTGPDHVFAFVNAAHRRLFGDRGAVGRPVREVFPELIHQGVIDILDAVYATGERHVARSSVIRVRDGSDLRGRDFYLDYIFAPITGPDGQVVGIFCEGHDVTQAHLDALERATVEAALRERERELRLLADALPVLVAYVDRDLRYKFVNRVYEDWFDQSREEIQGRVVAEVVGPDAFVAVRDRLQQALAGERVTFEQMMPYATVGHRHIRVEYVPRFNADGAVEGIYSLVQDITQAKLAEAALRESEEQLRLATEAAEIGLWDVDPVNDRVIWQPRVRAMFGVSPDQPVALADFFANLHPDDRAATNEAYAAAVDPERRALYDVEYRAIGKEDGIVRWVAAKGRGFFDEAGRCVRVLGTAIDVTRRKSDEERLRILYETLERRVAEGIAERKLLADIVDGTDMLVQVIDQDYRWLAINRAASEEFARLFQVRRPQVGDLMLDLLADRPDEQAVVRALWTRAGGRADETHNMG